MAVCEALPESSPRVAAWSELIDNYGIDANAAPWGCNAIASDAVMYTCGRLARPSTDGTGALAEHGHDPHELALCTKLSNAIAEVLADAAPLGSDEGSHGYFPFAAPALSSVEPMGEVGLVTLAELHAACKGALVPALRFDITSLDGMLETRAREDSTYMEAEEVAQELAPFKLLVEWVRGQDAATRASATYFFPLSWSDVVLSVFPHFVLVRTAAGSVVGAASMSVWT